MARLTPAQIQREHPALTRTELGDRIFVFGSNLAGRHGRGAALWARYNAGAHYGVGRGPTGQAYALPTKGHALEVLPLNEIARHVADFLDHARAHPERRFYVTPIGCGLAGYSPERIAPMFANAPSNCDLPDCFVAT